MSKSVSGYFKRKKQKSKKKVPMTTLPRGGGGKGLSGRATKKRTFLRLPLSNIISGRSKRELREVKTAELLYVKVKIKISQ